MVDGAEGAPDGSGNLADLVRRAARRDPERAALLFRDERVSWADLDERVDRVAAALRRLGLAAGDRLAVQLGNTPDFPAVYFGALRAGLVVVPVNPAYTLTELEQMLADSGATALVTTTAVAHVADRLRMTVPSLRHVVSDGPAGPDSTTLDSLLADADAADAADGPVEPSRGGEDLGVLVYTSGTSGRPRGAMLSHRALLANLEQCARISPAMLRHDDVVLLVLPLFHVYGLNPGLGMVAWHGATGVLVERFDPYETLVVMVRHGVTSVIGAPPMYVAWSLVGTDQLTAAFGQVRLALSGSAPLPAGAMRQLAETTGLQVFEGYGLTETAPVLTSTLVGGNAKPDSIGQPIPGVELRLADEDGEEPEEGDPGEIVVRGPNLFSGYWPDGVDGPDADGWFATGDLAYADADGDLHLVGRRKELILVSGFNVYPREVENVLLAQPGIAEAAVIGIPHPYTGETVKALIVLEPGARLTAEAIIARCEESLARFKCPTTVEFVAELPHSAIGKVSKGLLRADAPAAAAGAGTAATGAGGAAPAAAAD